jgi:hypothetical protein
MFQHFLEVPYFAVIQTVGCKLSMKVHIIILVLRGRTLQLLIVLLVCIKIGRVSTKRKLEKEKIISWLS